MIVMMMGGADGIAAGQAAAVGKAGVEAGHAALPMAGGEALMAVPAVARAPVAVVEAEV
jgi:hypothetical protein